MVAFVKMHGLGNDFVVVDGRGGPVLSDAGDRRRIADRRRGVGCDQLLVIEPAQGAGDAFMRIYNPDGGEAEACGNGTRCVAALLMDEAGRDTVCVETAGGLLMARRRDDGLVAVDMGAPRFEWDEIPLASPMDTLHLDLEIGDFARPAAVGMGNPHCVFFVEDVECVPLAGVGPMVEHHELFPARTNVEFASLQDDGSIRLRVWERAAGITLACGSGACATFAAAHRRGLVGERAEIELDGGRLTLEFTEGGRILMTGPVAMSFEGAWQR